jgi:serine/threonine protein kinase
MAFFRMKDPCILPWLVNTLKWQPSSLYVTDGIAVVQDHLRSDMHSLLAERIHPRRMRKWIAQMVLGIASLHDMGIIHRDIKPENVLVDRCDNIRLFDYGVAHIHNKPVRRGKKYSKELVGTRQYLAPECLNGKSYGPTVDYWALGCTVFDLLAGDVSFRSPCSFSRLGAEC